MAYDHLRKLHTGRRFSVFDARRADGAAVIIKQVTSVRGELRGRERLRHEYDVLSALHVRGVPRPLELTMLDRRPALVLERVGQRSLAELLGGRPLDIEHFVELAIRMAEIVRELHSRGVIHRDVSPENFVVGESRDAVALVDFEVATAVPAYAAAGELDGTLAYMPPEQTGRAKRPVDRRADLYALGATFYEMLTGKPPFAAHDPLELVHAHAARAPHPPALVNPAVPPGLSNVVLKLLAKMPEWRYQTAEALVADLAYAQRCLRAQGSIPEFELGRRDLPYGLFLGEDRLHGRAEDCLRLERVFDRVAATGAPEVALVTGPAGIGKSALIAHVQDKRSDFRWIIGRGDAFRRNEPYAPLADAFRGLLQELLAQPEEAQRALRERVQAAIAPNGRVLTDAVPDLIPLLGEQPRVAEVGAVQSEHRFTRTFVAFVRALVENGPPLCVFADDLQWIDEGSLKLLYALAAAPDMHRVLVLLAYRSDEIGPEHPAARAIEAIRSAGVRCTAVELASLDDEALSALVRDALRLPSAEASRFAQLLGRKTAGNPFFVRQFLGYLHSRQLLRFDAEQTRWTVDFAAAERTDVTPNVVDLLVLQIEDLPLEAQYALTTAACVGSHFELTLLAGVRGESVAATAKALWRPLDQGLLETVAGQPPYELSPRKPLELGMSRAPTYRFAHDRVRQVAYALLPEQRRKMLHLRIAEWLQENVPEDALERAPFMLADQLGRAAELLPEAERIRLAGLDERAGRSARAAAAYESALHYFCGGLAALPAGAWRGELHGLWFALQRGAAECAGLTGQLELGERLVEEGAARTDVLHEKAELHVLGIRADALRGAHAAALERGFRTLDLLGVDLPRDPSPARVRAEKERALAALRAPSDRELLDAPIGADVLERAKLQLFTSLTSAWFEAPQVFKVVSFRAAELVAREGLMPGAGIACAYLGIALVMEGDYEAAYRSARLAVRVAERSRNPAEEATALLCLGSFVIAWRAPIAQSLPVLQRAYACALESGALESAVHALTGIVMQRMCAGDPLDHVLAEADAALAFFRKVQAPGALWVLPFAQAVKCMKGQTRGPASFDDGSFREEQFAAQVRGVAAAHAILHLLKIRTAYLLCEQQLALEHVYRFAPEAERLLRPLASPFLRVDHDFYSALVLAGPGTSPDGEPRSVADIAESVREHLRRLEAWASSAPANWAHKRDLVAAELARVEGRAGDALALYQSAIEHAAREHFVPDEALAHELCGALHRAQGRARLADMHLRAAIDGYAAWGATAKVQLLERSYPQLRPASSSASITAPAAPPLELDHLGLLRATEALGAGLVFDRLLETLVRTCLQAAAAERAVLVIDEGGLIVRASASTRHDVIMERRPLAASHSVPKAVIERAFTARESVVAADAAHDERFAGEGGVSARKVRSLLALPIVRADRALGVLYFENNLASNVFSPQRVQLLRLLAVELAIAVENGRLMQQRDERERHLRLVFRRLPGAVWATDDRLRITYATGRLFEGMGLDERKVVGTTAYDFIGTSDPTEPSIAHVLAALAGQRQRFDYRFRERWFSVIIDPLRDADGQVVGSVGAAFDITDNRKAEERLARSEARLLEAQRVAHIGSFEWDVQSDVVTWSEELHRIYGVEPDQFGGKFEDFLARVHPEEIDATKQAIFDAYRASRPFVYDHRVVRADGTTRVLHTRGDVIKNGTGVPVRVVGTCWDVTELTEATRARERFLSLLRATLEATADGILVVDRERKVTLYNRRFLELWRMPAELVGQDDEEGLVRHIVEQIEDPEAFLRGRRERYANPAAEGTDIIRCKDGRMFERYSRPQRIGETLAGTVWSFRDITEPQRLLQRALFVADVTRLLASLELEPALEGLAHLSVPYLGETCTIDLFGDGEPRRLIASSTGDGRRPPAEVHPTVLGGHGLVYGVGPTSFLGVPIMMKARVLGAITLSAPPGRSYTTADLEHAEELARRTALAIENVRLYRGARDALRARDEFLSIAAHEIRGPLNAIHLAVQSMVQEAVPRESLPRLLDVIERQDRRLARFVDELLDLARIRAGRFHLELSQVDLVQVVREVLSQLEPDIARSKSTVAIEAEGEVTGQWDRSRLEQVVLNLLTNAIKFGLGKPIAVTIGARGGRARLEVSDQGIGIDPQLQERLFSPFERGVSVRHYGGLGLGLYIASTIVEALGGTIHVDSEAGRGACFRVELPQQRAQAADEAWLVH
jgi:PAS domain S-box-containing protein